VARRPAPPTTEPQPPPDRDPEAEPAQEPSAAGKAAAPPLPPFELSDAELARARKYQKIVARAAAEHGVDANLLNGIIWIETKFNARARNRSGAAGLMQLMPITSKAMAKRLQRPHRPLDPDFNIHAGAKLLSQLQQKFDGDENLALFGYARGGGRVRAWQETPGEPLPEGVQNFIWKVRRAQLTFRRLGFPGVRSVQANAAT
jgi:soluble lytic murein transglycosylase-like protein